MQRSASAMYEAGNTIDQAIALFVASNNVVQDPESVGTAWKTVSMRIRGVKTELEEAGLETEGMAESTAKLREQIKALTNIDGKGGIDILADDENFKSTYDIILEISKVWQNINDIDQAALLELLAGKRQGNIISAALTNMTDGVNAYETSLSSLGSAEAEHEKWMDSIQAKQQKFQAQYQVFANAFLSSDLVGAVYDIGTGLLSILTPLAKINALLPLIAASMAIINYYSLAKQASASAAAAASLVGRLISEKTVTDGMVVTYQALNAQQKLNVVTKLEDAVATGSLTAAEYADIRAKLGLAAATTGAKVATDGLNVSLKSLLLSNPAGWILTAISLLPMLIGLFSSLHKSNEELIQDAEDLKSAYSNDTTKLSGDVSTLEDLREEYDKLSKGVDTYGNNVSLAADDYERYQDIVSTILGISPQLITGYDNEGRAISNKNGLLEQSIKLLQEEQRLKTQELVSDDSLSTIGTGAVAKLKEYEKDNPLPYGDAKWDFMQEFRKAASRYAVAQGNYEGEIYNAFNFDNRKLDDFWTQGYWSEYGEHSDTFAMDYYEQIVESLRNNEGILENYFTHEEIQNLLKYANKYDENLSIYNRKVAEYSKSLNPTLQYVPQTITAYSELTDAQKQFLSEYINTFSITSETTEDDIVRMKDDILSFTDFVANNKDLKETVNIGITLQNGKGKDGTALSVADYEEQVQALIDNIGTFDEEKQVILKTVFGIDDSGKYDSEITKAIDHTKHLLENEYDSMVDTLSVDEVLQIYYNISGRADSMTFDELMGQLNEVETVADNTAVDLSETFEKVTSGSNAVTSAINAQTTGIGLSVESYQALIEADSRYADCLEYSNGQIILNTDSAKALSDANINSAKSQIAANKAADEAEYARLASDIENLTDEELSNLDALEQQIAKYDVMSSELDQLTSAYQGFLDAQGAAEQGDMYDDAIEALKVLKDTLYDAESEIYQKVGRAEYKAALEFVVGDVTLEGEALDRAIDAAERYLTEDSSGVGNFVADLIAKGFVDGTTGQLTEGTFINGEYVETSIDNIRKYLVDGLTLSEEMVRSMFGELEEYGSEFEWTAFESTSDDLYEAYKTVKQIKDALDKAYSTNSDEVTELSQALAEANAALAEQQRLSTERVSTYLRITEEIQTAQGILDELRESGASEVDIAIAEEGLAELQTLRDTLGEPTQLELEVAEEQLTTLKGQIDSAWEAGDTELLVTLGVAESEDGVTQSAVDAKIEEIENQLSSLQLLIDTSQGEEALNDFNSYTTYVEDFFGKTYTLQVNTSAGQSRLSSINSQLNSIRNNLRTLSSFSITFSANSGESELLGSFGTAFAGGRYSPFSGGKVLTGELGQELVVDPNTGKWYTVGNNGAEFVTLPKNAIVFNHKQTERLMASGKVSARGFAMAYGTAKANDGVSGTINITNIYNANGGTLGGKPSAVIDNTSLEEQLKETLDKMADEIAKIIGNFEHSIFLMEKNGGSTEDIISTYEAMQQAVHEQAQKYRAMGFDDNSDYIQELQVQWYDYADAISELEHGVYEKYLSDTEHAIDILDNIFENAASSLNLPDMRDNLNQQMGHYKDIMEAAHAEAERLRAKGVKENDELIQELQKTWWDAYNNSKEVLTKFAEDITGAFSGAVDEIQDVYDTLVGATEEYAELGYITVDTYQDILSLGSQYTAYLVDENGMLKVNKEAIEAMTAAKVDDLAVTQAMTLIDTIKQYKDDADALNALAFATNTATTATWGLVYAELAMLGLDDQLYTAFLNQINAIRAMAESAKQGIGQNIEAIRESNEETKDALDTILDLTKELIKWEVENQVEALEAQVDAYKKIVDLKKESIAASKEESNYQKDVSERVKKIADIQAKLRQLERDDSREAQAERASLSEELADLQVDLADYQADYAYNAQVDALDAEYEAYEELKQREMEVLEATISSEEKLYQLAIDRINNQWDTLYADIIAYNYEAGNTIESEIVSAWNLASAAVQQYGSYAAAAAAAAQSGTNNGYIGETQYGSGTGSDTGLTAQGSNIKQQMMANSIAWYTANDAQRASLETSQQALVKQWKDETGEQLNRVNGTWYRPNGQAMYTSADIADQAIPMIVSAMKANSSSWNNASQSTKDALSAENKKLGGYLQGLTGQSVTIDSNGVWWIGNRKLYDVYHGGLDKGYVGSNTGSADEILAILRKGELVLTKEQYTKIAQTLADGGGMVGGIISKLTSGSSLRAERIIETVTNNSEETDNSSGDTFIETVKFEYPGAISREEKNEIAQWTLGVIQDGIKKSGTPASTGRFRTKN